MGVHKPIPKVSTFKKVNTQTSVCKRESVLCPLSLSSWLVVESGQTLVYVLYLVLYTLQVFILSLAASPCSFPRPTDHPQSVLKPRIELTVTQPQADKKTNTPRVPCTQRSLFTRIMELLRNSLHYIIIA